MFPHWKKSGMCEHKMAKKYVSRTQYSAFLRAMALTQHITYFQHTA